MTLTQAATLTRKSVVIFIVLIILAISGSIGYNIWYRHYLSTLPPIVQKPEMKFGKLPSLEFPSANVSSSNFSYSLDTTTGELPEIPKLIKVYFIPQAAISLLAPEKTQKLAVNLGFPNGPEASSSSEYRFRDETGGELIVDVPTGNFNFQRIASTSAVSSNLLPDKTQIISDFKKYLDDLGLLTEELKNGTANVKFNNSTPTDSDAAEITLLPANIDNLPLITAYAHKGLVRTTQIKSNNPNNKYNQMNYVFWLIDKTTSSTYPLKTASTAFADLQAGLGFVSVESSKPQASISSVYLAYFQTEKYSPYLQPVFIFEGPEFTAIVPAIDQP